MSLHISLKAGKLLHRGLAADQQKAGVLTILGGCAACVLHRGCLRRLCLFTAGLFFCAHFLGAGGGLRRLAGRSLARLLGLFGLRLFAALLGLRVFFLFGLGSGLYGGGSSFAAVHGTAAATAALGAGRKMSAFVRLLAIRVLHRFLTFQFRRGGCLGSTAGFGCALACGLLHGLRLRRRHTLPRVAGHYRDLFAVEFFNACQIFTLLGGAEAYGHTIGTGTGCAADAMHIGFGHFGQVVVEYMRKLADINAARGNIRGHQHTGFTGLKALQRIYARGLAFVAVNGRRCDASLVEQAGNAVCPVFGAAENQRIDNAFIL